MTNVYDGTVGTLVNTSKIIVEIEKYIVNHPDDYGYEIKESDKIKIVAILGKNEHEEKIPPFSHPLVFEGRDKKTYIAADFRLFTKSKIPEDVVNIVDVLNDSYNGRLLMYRVMFTKLEIESNIEEISGIKLHIAQSFSKMISNSYFMFTMDESIKDSSYMVAMMHYYTMDSSEDGSLSLRNLINALPLSLSIRVTRKDLEQYYKRLDDNYQDAVFPSRTIYDLTNNIKAASISSRVDKINTDILINSLNRLVYSNNTENTIAMIENKPTFISLLYMALTESFNSKSTLRKIVNSEKYMTKPKDIVSTIKKIIDSNLVIVK